MLDYEKREMEPSWFCIPQEALSAVRKMLDPECSESYQDLREQFMKNIPADKKCFLGIDDPHASGIWNEVKKAGYLTVFDPGDDLVAVISKDDILHKEDFAALMKETGLETTNGNFNNVWSDFCNQILSAASLRDGALAAVQTAKRNIERETKLSLTDQIQAAQNRCTGQQLENRILVQKDIEH